jgi:hypothetical protein
LIDIETYEAEHLHLNTVGPVLKGGDGIRALIEKGAV